MIFLDGKAAALLHSIVRNHALVDGNKRLAWTAAVVFSDINGAQLEAPEGWAVRGEAALVCDRTDRGGWMSSTELLSDTFDRIRGVVHSALKGATTQVLNFRPDPETNTIAWLVWHLTRVQDSHIAELVGEEQVWIAGGWADRFDLPFERDATGYGQSAQEVAAVRADEGLLAGYYDAVHVRTIDYLHGLRGMPEAQVHQMIEQVTGLANAEGIDADFRLL